MRLALRGARRCGRAAYDDAYEEVDVADAAARFGTLEAARLVFEASARAQQPVLTSVRSRELLCDAAQLGAGCVLETCWRERERRFCLSLRSPLSLGSAAARLSAALLGVAPSPWLCAALRTPGSTITLGGGRIVAESPRRDCSAAA